MNISLSKKNLEIFEKYPSKFGNGAHILLSCKYKNRKIKIITGKVKDTKNKITINLFGNEILERTVKDFGTGFHITIPRNYLNQKLILIGEKDE